MILKSFLNDFETKKKKKLRWIFFSQSQTLDVSPVIHNHLIFSCFGENTKTFETRCTYSNARKISKKDLNGEK